MAITAFPIGYLDTNCYVISHNSDAIIVDPGGTTENGLNGVIDYIGRNKLTVQAIILTHLHFDHIYGVAELLRKYQGINAYASEADFPLLDDSLGNGSAFGLPPVEAFTPTAISEGPCTFGNIHGEIRMTPGHSKGGLALYLPDEKAVISGDSLFYRSIGRTDFKTGSLETLLSSIENKLFTLPDETIVYPGHGPSTCVGDEKKHGSRPD